MMTYDEAETLAICINATSGWYSLIERKLTHMPRAPQSSLRAA